MEEYSLRLCRVLEDIGVSDGVRKKSNTIIEMKDIFNVILTDEFYAYLTKRIYTGSYGEGTFRRKLGSDKDMMYIYYQYPVSAHYTSQPKEPFFRIVSNKGINPGYVKLVLKGNQKDLRNLPFSVEKGQCDRYLLVNEMCQESSRNLLDSESFVKNGPAFTTTFSHCSPEVQDSVYGLQLLSWPPMANEWLERQRLHAWPTPDTIKELQKIPCFVVPVGHKSSQPNKFEWRLSFNLQERYLMVSLNEIQFKCFMLLKYIKESCIKSHVGKSLTSYHCKTSLFYTIEENQIEIWAPEKLTDCFVKCLQRILQWTIKEFCPNYFIPKCNLFDGKIEGKTFIKLRSILQDIISRPRYFISMIEHDYIDKQLESTSADKLKLQTEVQDNTSYDLTTQFLTIMDDIFESLRETLYKSYPHPFKNGGKVWYASYSTIDTFTTAKYHIAYLNGLRKKESVTLELVESMIALSLASHLAVLAIEWNGMYRDWYIYASAMYFWKAMLFESRLSRLKLANVLHVMGHTESAIRLLDDVENVMEDVHWYLDINVASEDGKCPYKKTFTLDEIVRMSIRDLVKSVSGPVIFLPTEFLITPDNLKYEMFRSIATPPMKIPHNTTYRFEWAVLDVNTFYHLLRWQTGCYASYGNPLSKIRAGRVPFSHVESKFNPFGWIAKKSGFAEEAGFYFFESWRIFKIIIDRERRGQLRDETEHLHNAAVLHFVVLAYEYWILSKKTS